LHILVTILIASSAIAFALLFSRWIANLWQKIRNSSFHRQDVEGGDELPALPAPAILTLQLPPDEEQLRKSGTDRLDGSHREAITLQNRYHDAVASGVAALSVGFLSEAIAATVGADSSLLLRFCASLDCVCFGLALFSFWRAIHTNKTWVSARARNELLRQWCTIDNLLLDDARKPDVASRFDAFAGRITALLYGPETSWAARVYRFIVDSFRTIFRLRSAPRDSQDLQEKIAGYWSARRSELEKVLATVTFTPARLAIHFQKRPRTQAIWFGASRNRLVRQSHWRSTVLVWSFFLTLMVSVAKGLLVFGLMPSGDRAEPYLTLVAFFLIGVSSTLTGLYLNQNARSLIHRYRTQDRKIRAWISHYAKLFEGDNQTDTAQFSDEARAEIAAQILAFEDLMIDELIDWIAITEDDVMELAP
jgi:hypothetical protein